MSASAATESMPATRDGVKFAAQDARAAMWVFLFFFALYLCMSSGRVRVIDEVLPVWQTESLVQRGSTAVPQAVAAKLFYGKFDRNGQPQAPYAPGHAVASVPWYLLGNRALAHLPGVPQNARDLVTDFTMTLSTALYAALCATFAFAIFTRLGANRREAFFAAGILALATPLFSYSTWFYSEPLAAVLMMAAALALFFNPPGSQLRLIAGGLLLGALIWVRPQHALTAGVFLVALWMGRKPQRNARAGTVAACVALAGLAYLFRNYLLFGDWLDFGYPKTAEAGRQLITFDTPLLTGLYGFLLSPGKSVLLFAPPILLAVLGVPKLFRANRGLAIAIVGVPLVYLAFYARYTLWEGGYSFGPRYLVPAIVMLCLGIGPVLVGASPRVRRIAVALFVLGLAVQLVGVSTSFLEDQANGSYYDEHYKYRLNHSPLLSQSRLLLHYISSPEPAPIGRGFDRWFVFLHKGGVSTGTLAGIGLVFAALLIFSAFKLRQALRIQSVT